MAARALAAAPGALRALRRPGLGRVELVLDRAAYVRLGDDWLLLAEPDSRAGPLGVAVAGLDFDALRPGLQARLERGRLLIGRQEVSLERVRERRPGASPVPLPAGTAPGVTGAPPAGLADGLRALRHGRITDGVRLLAGRGEGLTPAGDDVLAGYAAWRHAAGRPVAISRLAAGRSSPLGLAYLRCAERGELPDAGRELLFALRAGDAERGMTAVQGLRAWGSSSGAALAWGISAGAGPGAFEVFL